MIGRCWWWPLFIFTLALVCLTFNTHSYFQSLRLYTLQQKNGRNLYFKTLVYNDDHLCLEYQKNDYRVFDFDSTLKQCRKINNFDSALALAERVLLLRPVPPSLLTGVIKVFGESKNLGRAVSLLKTMQEEMNVVPNEYHMSALIIACRNCKQWELALELFNRMDKMKIPKNTIVCNGIISTLGDAVQIKEVFNILTEMTTLNINKDIVTYSSAITAFQKAGEWQKAIDLYHLLKKENITPNSITLNAVLNACARGRQLQMALDLFSSACKENIQVDTISYSIIIKVCGDVNEYDLAMLLFEAMGDTDTDTNINIATNADTSSHLCSSSSPSSQFSPQYIEGIISQCKKVRRDTGCFNAMITCCERTVGKWAAAINLFDRMTKEKYLQPDCKTYTAVISR